MGKKPVLAPAAVPWVPVLSGGRIAVVVRPNASLSAIEFDASLGAYRVSLKAHPLKGEANRELIRFLHKQFGMRASIVRGLHSRKKIVELS